MELRTEDDIGPYKRYELLTGKIYYPALGYSGYGDGKSTQPAFDLRRFSQKARRIGQDCQLTPIVICEMTFERISL